MTTVRMAAMFVAAISAHDYLRVTIRGMVGICACKNRHVLANSYMIAVDVLRFPSLVCSLLVNCLAFADIPSIKEDGRSTRNIGQCSNLRMSKCLQSFLQT